MIWKPVSLGLAIVLLLSIFTGLTRNANVRKERDEARKEVAALTRWADRTCLLTGSAFGSGKNRGAACFAEVEGLAKFKAEALAASNTALLESVRERDAKTTTDAAAARAAAERSLAALRNMEKADAAVEGDRVDGAWAGAFNDLAGLRSPG